MTINHIDQLTEWWKNAEDAPASPGDRIIERHVRERDEDTHYTIGVHREGMRGLVGNSGTRILARAPKPTPAWHNAVAVIASTDRNGPQVWQRCGGHWDGTAGDEATAAELHDVTPLIEAKATDEMVKRAMAFWDPNCPGEHDAEDIQWAREFITAALGLETA